MKKSIIGKQPAPQRRISKKEASALKEAAKPSWERAGMSIEDQAREKKAQLAHAAKIAHGKAAVERRRWVDARAKQLSRVYAWAAAGETEKFESGCASLKSEASRKPPPDPEWEAAARRVAMTCWLDAANARPTSAAAKALEVLGAALGAPKEPEAREAILMACIDNASTDEALRMLEKLGWEPLSASSASKWALRAARVGTMGSLKWLGEKGADFSWLSPKGESAVGQVVSSGAIHCLAWLLERGAHPDLSRAMDDATGVAGLSPLMRAAVIGSKKMAEMLLAAGADMMKRDALGMTACDHAKSAGRAEVASWLEGVMLAKEEKFALESEPMGTEALASVPARRM